MKPVCPKAAGPIFVPALEFSDGVSHPSARDDPAGMFCRVVNARTVLALIAGWQPGVNAPAISAKTVRAFTTRQNIPAGSSRALGWDTPSENSSAGTKMGPNAFGHTGFTGTSIWFDPDRNLFIILLTNRVNPTRANTKILQVRRRVADLVNDALTPPQ